MKGTTIDYEQLFKTLPGLYLILFPDLTIVAVNDAYMHATMTERDQIVGRPLFEVFPDNPDDSSADGVSNLLQSLNYVRKHKKAHAMAVQKYDIRRPDGSFEERYWSPLNTPVLSAEGKVTLIIHRVEDVTQFIFMQKENLLNKKLTRGLQKKLTAMESEIVARSREIQQVNTELEVKVQERTDEILKNERRFKALIEHNYDAVTLSDINQNPIYQSPSTERLLGWTLEERKEIGPTVIHPEDMKAFRKLYTQVLANPDQVFYTSHRMKHKEGHYIWVEGHISNQLNTPGISAIVSNFRDITERKKTEEQIRKLNEELEEKIRERTQQLEIKLQQLRESENKFQKAFHASAAGMTITRLSDSSYLDVNNTFINMTGLSREELIGHTSVDTGIVVDMEKWKLILKHLHEKGTVKNVELSLRNRSGEIIETLSSVETVTMDGEKYAIHIIYDITERKKAEKQLEAVNNELEAFSYSISHDLRAPLRAINGYAEMLMEDYGPKLDEEANRILNNIKYYAEKMGTLIDELLTFSRLGRKELQKLRINMNELLEGVLSDLNKLAEHRADIRISKLHSIHADYGLMHQVMFNLLSNAVKYSSLKEKSVVEIASEEKNGEIIFSVKDNGAGFNMQYADKLFGVFQRLHSQEEFTGTGVGLAIVQRIITKHGGKVWAEARINEGATFYFSLSKHK